jgi:hypothetical protein
MSRFFCETWEGADAAACLWGRRLGGPPREGGVPPNYRKVNISRKGDLNHGKHADNPPATPRIPPPESMLISG